MLEGARNERPAAPANSVGADDSIEVAAQGHYAGVFTAAVDLWGINVGVKIFLCLMIWLCYVFVIVFIKALQP